MGETKWATSFWARLRGLFSDTSFKGVLVLAPCKSIHTYYLRRDIDVAFVGKDGTVLASHLRVNPGKRLRHRKAVLVLERFSTLAPWFEVSQKLSFDLINPRDLACRLPHAGNSRKEQ